MQIETMRTSAQLLHNIRVATPCPARWEDMEGSEQCRFCRHCQKHVYNFSEMTAEAVIELLREKEGNLCARFYQRADGTLLTSDCGLAQSRPVVRFQKVLLGIAAGVVTFIGTALGGDNRNPRISIPTSPHAGETNLQAPMTLGKIICPPRQTPKQTNAPSAKPDKSSGGTS